MIHLLGVIALKYASMAKFRGLSRTAAFLFPLARLFDPQSVLAQREVAKLRRRRVGGLPDLRCVGIGTTGTCNASCVHCPTGKESTSLSPRQPMPMDLFRKIIDGIVEEGVGIEHNISFGLFGDGLVDPFVVERARYLRERLPDALFSVNTNGAAFNLQRHQALSGFVSVIALHCESLVPETFDHLMAPLRLKNVLPKYEAILRAFPNKVRVSVPVSRANFAELEDIRTWFLDRGVRDVVFDPMSSRCAEDRSVFDRLSLAPIPIRCGVDVAADLIVDCDGKVLTCCQDFSRLESIGDLAVESFRETMTSLQRVTFRARMASGRHDELTTCNRCFGDRRSPNFPFDLDAEALGLGPAVAK